MTRIKLCGLTRLEDILAANELNPEYIGFVFAPKSRRYVTLQKAVRLKKALDPKVRAVGVFVNETVRNVAAVLNCGVIDIAQLHGNEDEEYIKRLRRLTDKPLIRAFRMKEERDIVEAGSSGADYILFDSGAGTGETFDWKLIRNFPRPYFLAGGLDPGNVGGAVKELNPYGVDVSSGIETDGLKDKCKMAAFVAAVRKENKNDKS